MYQGSYFPGQFAAQSWKNVVLAPVWAGLLRPTDEMRNPTAAYWGQIDGHFNESKSGVAKRHVGGSGI
jgi:hypothetical protein